MADNRPPMPARGHTTAPTFDPAQPRTLRRFFQDIETLFERSGIDADEARKSWVVRYLPIDVADLCESLPEFSDDAKTYDDFKAAVIALYPGAGEDRKFSVADVESLVAKRAASPITSISELSAYYREFFTMTSYLMKHKRLSESEQSRLFVRGIAPPLWDQVSQRLQLKLPDHYPDDPYKLEQVYDAAKFVLHGTLPAATTGESGRATNAGESRENVVKVEELAPLLRLLAQSVGEGAAHAGAGLTNRGGNTNPFNTFFCHYCGGPNCQLRNCPFIDEDARAGRVYRNQDGRIMLPNGNFVPRHLPGFDGVTMRDRVYEWHRRNPNALAPQGQPQQAPPANAPGQGGGTNPAAQLFFAIAPETTTVAAFQLSTEERIDQLERELFNLRQGQGRARFDGVEVPRRRPSFSRSPAAQATAQPRERGETQRASPTAIRDTTVEAAANRREEEARAPRAPTPMPTSGRSEKGQEPEHPFAKARDATYAPPTVRNFGAPPPKPKEPEREAAYRTQAPVHDIKFAEEIFARSMKTPVITLSPEELLSIAPEVRAKYREAVTPRRVPTTRSVNFATVEEVPDEDDTAGAEQFLASVSCSGEPLEPGAYVLPDPYEVYLRDVAPDREPSPLNVAKESYALRSIVGLVDNKEYVEAIVDPGCMVIAMSENVCHALGMWYDPSIQLHMISANGEVDKSLGLVRNVPFCVADIVLYLQVHVIRNAAYDMLLGRPFDVLTKSVVKNFENEDQTITIRCPNTGQRPSPQSAHEQRRANTAQPEFADTYTQATGERPVFTFSYETEEGSYTVTPRGEREPASILLSTKKKYKPVDKKVRATLGTCPERFRIERNIVGDPLATMPTLNPNPPEFTPTGRYTAERKEAMDRAHNEDFLWPEERKLLHDFMSKHNDAFAWSDAERGCFKPEYFPP
ncbi:hypothetical protein FKP32DRAFT_1576974, partial [Trametes sanguinea]